VGTNYLQLPVNRPQCPFATNQRDGQMAFAVDGSTANPHVNYEPSSRNGLQQQPRTAGPAMAPEVSGKVGRAPISRPDNFSQAGERYRAMQDWERDDLILNLTGALLDCNPDIQQRMVASFTAADPDYGRRLAKGLGVPVPIAAE
jgi:catalase